MILAEASCLQGIDWPAATVMIAACFAIPAAIWAITR